MASPRFFSRSLSISTRMPDLDRLPLTLETGRGAGIAVFLMLFALVWGGAPAFMLVTNWQELGQDAPFMLVFPLVGAGLFVFGFLSLFRRRTIVLDAGGVSGLSKSLFGRKEWREPLARYRGVLLKGVRIRSGKSSYPAHAVFLAHDDDDRAVPLYVVRDQGEARRFWERCARALRLDALEATQDGEVARRPEDLDKSVRELAAEGKLEVDFEARPPPPALAARYDGGTLAVSTAGPLLPRRAAPVVVAIPWLLVLGDALLLGGFATFFLVPVAILVSGGVAWDQLVRERLSIDRDGVGWQRVTGFWQGGPRYIASGRIEAVRIEGEGGKRLHLAIVADAMVLRFAKGRPREALEWARQAVLAHVAAPGDT